MSKKAHNVWQLNFNEAIRVKRALERKGVSKNDAEKISSRVIRGRRVL